MCIVLVRSSDILRFAWAGDNTHPTRNHALCEGVGCARYYVKRCKATISSLDVGERCLGAVLYLLFVVRFFARRAKKRTTAEMGSTILPFVLSVSKGRRAGKAAFESATA